MRTGPPGSPTQRPCRSQGTEEMLGAALEGVDRSSIVLSTKWSPDDWEGDAEANSAALRQSVANSLAALRTDYIDVMYFHGLPAASYDTVVSGGLYATMAALRDEGLIRHIGLTTRFVDEPGQEVCEIALQRNPEL